MKMTEFVPIDFDEIEKYKKRMDYYRSKNLTEEEKFVEVLTNGLLEVPVGYNLYERISKIDFSKIDFTKLTRFKVN